MPSARRRASLPRRSAIRRFSSEAVGMGVGSFMVRKNSVVVAYVVEKLTPEGVAGDVIEDLLRDGVGVRQLPAFMQLYEALEVGKLLPVAAANARLHGRVDHAGCQGRDPQLRVFGGHHTCVVIECGLGGAVHRPAGRGL